MLDSRKFKNFPISHQLRVQDWEFKNLKPFPRNSYFRTSPHREINNQYPKRVNEYILELNSKVALPAILCKSFSNIC